MLLGRTPVRPDFTVCQDTTPIFGDIANCFSLRLC